MTESRSQSFMALLLVGIVVVMFVIGLIFIGQNKEEPKNQVNEKEVLIEAKEPQDLVLKEIDIETLKDEKGDNLGMYARDEENYNSAVNNSFKTVNVDEYSTFFTYWFPDNWNDLDKKDVLFVLHGEDESAYKRALAILPLAKEKNLGIVVTQWGWKTKNATEFTYLDQTEVATQVLYDMLSIQYKYLEKKFDSKIDSVALLTYRRANSPLIGIAFLDNNLNKYVNYFFSISGLIEFPNVYVERIKNAQYGESVLAGQRFYLWCGEKDILQAADEGSGVQETNSCKSQENLNVALKELGAQVEQFERTLEGGQNTWFESMNLQTEAMKLWLGE